MTDLNRRNFLKGLMAAAGVAAVGIPVAPAVAQIAAEPPPLPFPDADLGDIFMKTANAWRFIGRSSRLQLTVRRDEEEIWISPRERRYRGLSTVDIKATGEVIFDPEGEKLLGHHFMERERTDFAIGQGYGTYVLKRSAIMSMSRLFGYDEDHTTRMVGLPQRRPRLGLGAVRNEFELNISEVEISRN
ncbi:twin-arginine translocation signal domain-containing protein [Mesorhizobium silamurunense]|uniref:twin-arginine translocation signal domain-containing protein n=1 Tax=Mesorhizobium silamurunense TaxID=499528 RepID=UPI0017823C47|nr:twin-arginine translocation signal domain-containing protein [Mesorhizobium silamurunense]